MTTFPANDMRLSKIPEQTVNALHGLIEQNITEQITPAVGLAVFHDDMPVFDAAWGYHDPQTAKNPVKTSTLFDIASLTQIYTAVALFSLMSEEAVYLHSPLVSVLPEFSDGNPRPIIDDQDPLTGEKLPPDPALTQQSVNPDQVTLFHLLTHTAGLPRYQSLYEAFPVPAKPDDVDSMPANKRRAKMLEQLCGIPFVGVPDTIVRYSDPGALLLGEVVARLHGEEHDLQAAIQARVLADRFESTTFHPLQNGFDLSRIAPTEDDQVWRKRRIHGEVHDENTAAAGGVSGVSGLFATAFDVALFGNIWLNRAEKMFRIDLELAGAASELQAQTDNNLRGLGWEIKAPQNAVAGAQFSSASYGHTGFTGTSLWIDPQSRLVVALLTNTIYYGREHIAEAHALRRGVHDLLGQWAQSV